MSEEIQHWLRLMHAAFPTGFYFKDLSSSDPVQLNWAALAAAEDPLFLYVGSSRIEEVVESLVQQGTAPSMACAAMSAGIRILGTLGDIALKTRKLQVPNLYLLVADDSVKLQSLLQSGRRLAGKTVLVTRAKKQAGELARLLEQEGARVLEIPTIQIVLQTDHLSELQQALRTIREYSWLILTSANTVTILDDVLQQMNLNWSLFDGLRIACIGTATAQQVAQCGGKVALVPPRFQAEGLIEAIPKEKIAGKRILLPRAKGSREMLPRMLAQNGAEVQEIHIYRAELPESGREELSRILSEEQIDFITFTSSSTVHNFVEMAGDLLKKLDLQNTRIASIGPITASTLEQYGIPAAIQAREFTIPGLVHAIVESFYSQSS